MCYIVMLLVILTNKIKFLEFGINLAFLTSHYLSSVGQDTKLSSI